MAFLFRFLSVLLLIINILSTISAYTGAKMGVLNENCDDTKTNLTIDWNGSHSDYECSQSSTFLVDRSIRPITILPDFNPKDDVVNHACMSKSIVYDDKPPLRGEHRPNWAIWGEYLYLPPQRWLHNLEHGGIIALYHTCADMEQINILKEVVSDCLYRHIITPYNKLTTERPLALLSWGSKLEMNYINRSLAEQFIKDRAKNKAPEDIPDDGQFSENLVKRAQVVSGDSEDNILCPYTI